MLPLQSSEQVASTTVAATVIGSGAVMVKAMVVSQPTASVTVNE
jgi:hypothetical protein